MIIHTRSGAIYEAQIIPGGHRLRRHPGPNSHHLSKDDAWVDILTGQTPQLGERLIVGVDYTLGNVISPYRLSSPITKIEDK